MLTSQNTRLIKQHKIPDTISNTLVIMMDVLEHLEHDDLMLNSIKNNCIGDHNYFLLPFLHFNHYGRSMMFIWNILDDIKYLI